jgi:hypothetical protein
MAQALLNFSGAADALNHAVMDSISPLATIFKIVGIALLAYILFLIIRGLFRWKTASDIGRISRNVEEINKKMDALIGKLDNLGKKETAKKPAELEVEKRKGFFKRLFTKSEKKENNKKQKKDKKI